MSGGTDGGDEVATASDGPTPPSEGPTAPFPAVSTTRLYSYLVTRHTGRAVRLGIERRLAEIAGDVLAVLDFQDVPVIDFSCADEIVVKLVRSAPSSAPGGGRTPRAFLIRGLAEHHRDPIESALHRQYAAVAAEDGEGRALVLGSLEAGALRTWHDVRQAGRTRTDAAAARLRMTEAEARRTLEALADRRLVLRDGEGYLSLWRVLARAREGGDGR